MERQEKWASVFSRDPLMEEDWGFLWFAHDGCADEYAKQSTEDRREFLMVRTSESATDGECEICSDLSHEERITRREQMISSGEIPTPRP